MLNDKQGIMEEFLESIQYLKDEGINDAQWAFLAKVLRAYKWTLSCHGYLIMAVEEMQKNKEAFKRHGIYK